MLYPYPNLIVGTTQNTIALDANVQAVVSAINADTVIPYGDYGETIVYYFQTWSNGLGNIIYTTFDRETTLALESFSVRYGAATTIRQILFSPFPKSSIPLQMLILPNVGFDNNFVNP